MNFLTGEQMGMSGEWCVLIAGKKGHEITFGPSQILHYVSSLGSP